MSFEKERKEQTLNKMALRPMLARDFDTSEAFVAQLGKSVTNTGMFIPMRLDDRFQVGDELEITFSLQGRKEILAGTVKVKFRRDGANGETPGCGVQFLELTERSQKNLALIESWRQSS